MGQKVFDLLLKLKSKEEQEETPKRLLLDASLVVGDSTAEVSSKKQNKLS